MSRDPIVDEIRAIRDEYAKQFDYDLDAIFHDIKKQETQSDQCFVTRSPKRIEPIKRLRYAGFHHP